MERDRPRRFPTAQVVGAFRLFRPAARLAHAPWAAGLLGLAAGLLAGCEAQLTGNPGDPASSGGGPPVAVGTGGSAPGTGGSVTTSSGIQLKGDPEFFRLVRLTHSQWENAVRDVLEWTETPSKASGFLPDPPEGKFSNNERALYLTDGLRLDLQRAAEEVAEQAVLDGGFAESFGTNPAAVIRAVTHRAFRRPASAEELQRYETLWEKGPTYFQSGDDFSDGARVFLEAVLQSPNFLYRIQLSEAGQRLDGPELATKLSFLLRDTAPSDELLMLAEAGELDTDEGLRSVAEDMVEEASSVVARLHEELFGLSRYHSIHKDAGAFPTYTEELNQTLYDADVMFFSHVFSSGGGVRSILTSQVAFANSELAPLYGISVASPTLTEVTLGPDRPGFLTRLGFLAYNANLSSTDPIHRGVEINNRLLCAELSPPPGEIPSLPAPLPGQTNRERVTAHTGEGFCGGCHAEVINPPGFALEGFDALGQAQTTDNGKPVDTSGSFGLLDGQQEFDGIVELSQLLAESPLVHDCYASHIMEYALARDLSPGEAQFLEHLGTQSAASELSIKELLLATVTSPLFTTSQSGTP